jgi:chemotaxis response regulator CheB
MDSSERQLGGKSQLYDLIVLGASAGGIQALSVLVATLPATLPVPIVIAQHLDPNVPSHLGQILARRSTLPVRTVGEAAPAPESLVAGTIYLVPADRDVEITDGTVHLQAGVGQHPMPSIDRLFTSAAKTYGERVIAVVLTGSGSDGTAGARAIKEAGGTVLIENPQTASYPAMPASLPPTIVDLVVDLERMGPLLADLISGAQTLLIHCLSCWSGCGSIPISTSHSTRAPPSCAACTGAWQPPAQRPCTTISNFWTLTLRSISIWSLAS